MLCEAIKETLSTKRMNLNYANITRSVFRFHQILKIDSQVNKILLKIEKINAPPPLPIIHRKCTTKHQQNSLVGEFHHKIMKS